MNAIHWISWLCLLSLIPPTAWILWIKNRSSVNTWIRSVKHPERWLLSTRLAKSATKEEIHTALKAVVTESKNIEWNSSCTYKKRDVTTGEWIVGLVSPQKPFSKETISPYSFTRLPAASTSIRVSCPTNEANEIIKADLARWSDKNNLTLIQPAVSLSAQSYQCWEWSLDETDHQASNPSLINRLAERIFEARDIALYPTLITIIALLLCGTGNWWLFAIGIFTVILMSGAHKFVFMYQREDITQEEHLQNY